MVKNLQHFNIVSRKKYMTEVAKHEHGRSKRTKRSWQRVRMRRTKWKPLFRRCRMRTPARKTKKKCIQR